VTEQAEARKSMYAAVYQQLNLQPLALDVALPAPLPPSNIVAPYAEEARLAGLEGTVLLTGAVTSDGSVQNLKVSRSLGLGLDEQAIAAAAAYRFAEGGERPQTATLPIEFTLPDKQSRWHLVGVEFKPPSGASRPTFAAADYPLGPGIGLAAYDEAEILSVVGRAASAVVSFDIDERGYPGNFLVENASAKDWGPEAVGVIQGWRFHPGMKAGLPISVRCTLSLIWGPEDFTSHAITGQIAQMYPPPSSAQPQFRAELWPDSAMISKTEPEYTEEARRAGIEGTVMLSVIADQEGRPASVRVIDSLKPTGLEESAMEAIKNWRFQPRILNGQPAAVPLTVQVNFRLTGVESSVFITPPVAVAAAPKPK
jgi:TonB family protein